MLAHWAPRVAREGWVCTHADLLRVLVALLKARPAPVRLYSYSGGESDDNAHAASATLLASQMARLTGPTTARSPLADLLSSQQPPHWPRNPVLHPQSDDTSLKVSTPLPRRSYSEEKELRGDGASDELGLDDLLWAAPGYQPKPILGMRRENLTRLVHARSPAAFWSAYKGLLADQPRPTLVTAAQLREVFQARMNPPASLPLTFDRLHHALNRITAHSLPRSTVDTTAEQFFSRPFSVEEVDAVKDHIPPQSWLTAIIAAVKKPKKDGASPESYRTIGLESCLLKTLTLLIDRRLRQWAESTGRLPPTQSGFRSGHRTYNNAFILRVAIEKARSLRRTLYVVYLDLSNAFPSVDQASLWAKLARWGASGPILDWLRMLYSSLEYLVRFGGESTECFRALMGILIGDPASPILWIIYISDFALRPHPDDVVLGGQRIAHLELADDIALLCLSATGMQQKLHEVEDYCARSFLLVNVPKTLASAHGPLPDVLPTLTLNNAPLQYVPTATYVGTTFTSTSGDIFRAHYDAKEDAARRTATAVYSLESYVGPLPPRLALHLYHTHVDPHLTAGCEVVLDSRPSAVLGLEAVQKTFLRRALHLSSWSPLTPLFTESGVWPLRYRRLELALRYLRYVLRDGPQLTQAAMEESWQLVVQHSSPSWWSDLHHAAAALPAPLAIPVLTRPSVDAVDGWIRQLPQLVLHDLGSSLLASRRLTVLKSRLQWDGRDGRRLLLRHVCSTRQYLSLPRQRQRSAIIRLLGSEHALAVELLRRTPEPMEREARLCRWCPLANVVAERPAVEDEVHVLLECAHPTLASRREQYLTDLESMRPGVRRTLFHLSRYQLLPYLLEGSRESLALLGDFVADVWDQCDLAARDGPATHAA
ncbi:hypothetical protein ONZ51_g2645 [Trametes cubensis]|uniref:Reverse transcriptase domain-containing protein n=1 Tax=Trametes cubensis TaxID=1111947 RepID=A0AAD7XBW8_9APHY|nr:hypothetical protein ONZ51_g2645 [Trametes cubensis]